MAALVVVIGTERVVGYVAASACAIVVVLLLLLMQGLIWRGMVAAGVVVCVSSTVGLGQLGFLGIDLR